MSSSLLCLVSVDWRDEGRVMRRSCERQGLPLLDNMESASDDANDPSDKDLSSSSEKEEEEEEEE
jgi:hypothetical protein